MVFRQLTALHEIVLEYVKDNPDSSHKEIIGDLKKNVANVCIALYELENFYGLISVEHVRRGGGGVDIYKINENQVKKLKNIVELLEK